MAFDWGDYLSTESHGGGCCGRSHLYNFPDIDDYDSKPTLHDREEFIRDDMFDNGGPHPATGDRCMVIEVVLAGEQYKQWATPLRRCGFKKVDEFINVNSGNLCHIFFLHTNEHKPFIDRRKKAKK